MITKSAQMKSEELKASFRPIILFVNDTLARSGITHSALRPHTRAIISSTFTLNPKGPGSEEKCRTKRTKRGEKKGKRTHLPQVNQQPKKAIQQITA